MGLVRAAITTAVLSGRVTVSFVTSGGECCDVSHQNCSPLPNRVTKVRVTVRRPRSG